MTRADASTLAEGADILKGEVLWALKYEAAHSLEDVLYRRTRAALYEPEQVPAIIEPAAELMAAELGWSTARRDAEIAAARARFEADCSFVSS